jgi:WD40 repeat protein/mono/diheme cytochrome c family protein
MNGEGGPIVQEQAMKRADFGQWGIAVILSLATSGIGYANQTEDAALATKAQTILKTNCYRCHGQEGAVEGGMNYVLDRAKLTARGKVVPGKPDASPLFKRIAAGKMPPPGETPRPSAEDVALLRQWIEAGAPVVSSVAPRTLLTEAAVYDLILADLDRLEKRSRRFMRYFSLAPLANAGAGPDELLTYRHALAKLLNSLSWHPRITLPKSIDPAGLVLRIDLRDYLWDANLWNRLLAEYPYGIFTDTAVARATVVATATRLPVVRLDWFVANASRPPLYYDLLQIPTNLAELERQLRVDAVVDVQQERVARAGFNGSGISRNNRVLERHDAVHGAYWRTFDFNAVPQNLTERDLLLPDRRNVFAYPLGPGAGDNTFQHAGGEVIFNLPNGLQGYLLVNADNQRIDKGPTAIVSDPKRPDRAVEAGISCIGCHVAGINPKDDQIRDHVARNPKAFSRADADLIRALYVPHEKMRALMAEDADRFRKAVEKTGNKVQAAEVVMAMTLRYEADVDLPTLAAEVGVRPEEFLAHLTRSEVLAKNLGALKVPGGTVARQVVVQAFGDVVRELRLGGVFQAGTLGQSLPDNTGEIDPLEAQSSKANAMVFSPDGRLAAFASADKTIHVYDVEAGRELRRCVGHLASVWCVAFSPDGTRLLSGGKDGTVRLWDTATGRELKRLEGHTDLVSAVAFSPDGRRALSTGFDQEAILWDLDRGQPIPGFSFHDVARYLPAVTFSPDGDRCLICGEKTMYLVNAKTGQIQRRLEGHAAAVVSATFSADGRRILSGSDDRTLRLWDVETGKQLRVFTGHANAVKCGALSPDGHRALSGGADATVRLWDVDTGKEMKQFTRHVEPLVGVTFVERGKQSLSGSRDGVVRHWVLDKITVQNPSPAAAVSPQNTTDKNLRPSAVIPVGGTIGNLLLSPDGKSLYFLNHTADKLGRIDTETLTIKKEVPRNGAEAVSLSPDGTTLVSIHNQRNAHVGKLGWIRLLDPASLELKKSIRIAVAPYDLAVGNHGLIFISGGGTEWSEVTVVDLAKEKPVATWAGVWGRSLLRLSPDERRLYYSSQGVTPGHLGIFAVPDKLADQPKSHLSRPAGPWPLGGDFSVSPEGKFLLLKNGTILETAANPDEDLKFHAAVEPFVSAAVVPEQKAAYFLTRDGTLKRHSYPDFKPRGSSSLGLAVYGMVLDPQTCRLFVAGFDPRDVADQPKARGFGSIYVYSLTAK